MAKSSFQNDIKYWVDGKEFHLNTLYLQLWCKLRIFCLNHVKFLPRRKAEAIVYSIWVLIDFLCFETYQNTP